MKNHTKLLIMKLSAIILFSVAFSAVAMPASSQNSRVRINGNIMTLISFIEQIESQTDYLFVYSKNEIDIGEEISVGSGTKTVAAYLDEAFSGSEVKYAFDNGYIVLTKTDVKTFAQDIKKEKLLKGKVTDAKTGEPVIGASIIIKGSDKGVVSDFEGNFSILLPEGGQIEISSIGFLTQILTPGNKNEMIIKLDEDILALEETIVVGYGSMTKRTITQAITKVKGTELENIPVSSLADALKGKVAGARIYTKDFSPGSEPKILIRGGSSINGVSDALVLVDGIERELSSVNSSDIESIEILKDAASSAIYGSRASNGVVLVTTKSGSKGTGPKITFDANVAYEEPESTLNLLNAEEFLYFQRTRISKITSNNAMARLTAENHSYSTNHTPESQYSTRYLNSGESIPGGYKSMVDPIDPSKTLIFQDNDWVSKSFAPAVWQNYNVTLDGGTDKVAYMASVGYTNDGGVAAGSGYERFNARTNIDAKISNKLRFKGGIDYQYTNTEIIENQQYTLLRGVINPPVQKYYYDAGEDYGKPTKGFNKGTLNPLFYEYYWDNNRFTRHVGANGMLEYEIVPKLKVVAQASTLFNVTSTEYYQAKNPWNGNRDAKTTNNTRGRNKLEVYMSYATDFERHSVSATAGYSYDTVNYFYTSAATNGATTDIIHTLNAGPALLEATSSKEGEVGIGYFGRINYDYAKKYLLTLTARYDGSSRFLDGPNQWGFFPGASAGWVISEEPWYNINLLNLLKLRLSYGLTGNNYVGYYDAVGEFGLTSNYNGNSALIPSSMPNKSLTWETTTQLDAGFDFGLLDNRITGSIDYYNKLTDNLIFSKTLPNTSGFSSIKTNIGQVRYFGADIEINTRNIIRNDFTWSSKFVWNWNDNIVESLPENGLPGNVINAKVVTMADGSTQYIGGIREGHRLGDFYGYEVDYLVKTQSQAEAAPYHSSSRGYDYLKSYWIVNTGNEAADKKASAGKLAIGDWCYKDFNGDGIINGMDASFYRGNTNPKHTGGMGNTFTYKNWTFDIYVDWALGFQSYNGTQAQLMKNAFSGNANLTDWVYKCWDPETNPDSEFMMYKGTDSDDLNKNVLMNQYFIQNNDYLCIRDVSLSYNWKCPMLQHAHIQNIMFTLSGNNLKYFSEIKGLTPEYGSVESYSESGVAFYPAIRKINFGVKVSF